MSARACVPNQCNSSKRQDYAHHTQFTIFLSCFYDTQPRHPDAQTAQKGFQHGSYTIAKALCAPMCVRCARTARDVTKTRCSCRLPFVVFGERASERARRCGFDFIQCVVRQCRKSECKMLQYEWFFGSLSCCPLVVGRHASSACEICGCMRLHVCRAPFIAQAWQGEGEHVAHLCAAINNFYRLSCSHQ